MKKYSSPLSYGIVRSEYGQCAVLMHQNSIIALSLGRPDFLTQGLQRDDRAAQGVIKALGSSRERRVPLQVEGTKFQKRVWNALRSIPRGETRTYGEVARMIGAPTSVRAVGSACAANRIAMFIPCHRVVPARGGSGAYRWGKKIKSKILSDEKKMAS
jgi:AraC family transcriptional regulator of adaptative response/methylated-DNA-[protein]-cysteine methyltransferase